MSFWGRRCSEGENPKIAAFTGREEGEARWTSQEKYEEMGEREEGKSEENCGPYVSVEF